MSKRTALIEEIEVEYTPSDVKTNQLILTIGQEKTNISINQFRYLVSAATKVLHEFTRDQIELREQEIEFHKASMACVRGSINKVSLSRVLNESLESLPPGFHHYDIDYFDDVEGTVLFSLKNVSILFMPNLSLFFETLKAYIGGNHQYTSKIAFDFNNFSFDSILEEFKELEELAKSEYSKKESK